MELWLPSLPLSLSFLLLLLLVLRRYLRSKSSKNTGPEFPGPWHLPLIGSLHHLVGALPHHALRDLARRHGPVMRLRVGQVDQIVLTSREGAQQILKAQDANFAFRPELTAAKIIAYGCRDVAFSNGEYWRQLRKLCVMELLGAKRVKSFASLRAEQVSLLMRDVGYAATAGKEINLGARLNELTNSIVVQASFGRRCPQQKKFMDTIKEVIKMSSGFSVGDLFPSLKIMDVLTGFSTKLIHYHKKLDAILEETIQEHLLSRRDDEEDLIDVLLRLKDQGDLEVPISYESIKALVIDLFAGGTETTANTIEWAMSELILHPQAMNRAQTEVREAMKGKGYVEESDVPQFAYIHSVVKETLRLHPPFPLLFPRVGQETTQVLGYTIPAGTRVLINVWALARDPKYWHDGESFKPERFQEGDDKEFKGNDFEFLPFGAGRRMCAGMSFGLSTLELALAQLLFHFDWALPKGMTPGDLDMAESFGSSASRKINLHLVPSPRFPLRT
ncbi:premnaspirodiene oxygenase-like [Zingiber officinale]|uniref:premnaspirodiene oxygenase-like n=1 Tax=Zingiber officinale TaxID=94328 RepID=UPI001C4D0781|nr:premnaspirodiene oxygenase-like [Zingiber officinale]